MVNVNRLKGKIIESGYTNAKFSKALGINPGTFYRKIRTGGGSFTVSELNKMVILLSLSNEECKSIFFAH